VSIAHLYLKFTVDTFSHPIPATRLHFEATKGLPDRSAVRARVTELFAGRRKMSTLVFALLVLVVLVMFLAFALALTAALLGSRGAQAEATKLFQAFAKKLGELLPRSR
jgi:hypothetical protein